MEVDVEVAADDKAEVPGVLPVHSGTYLPLTCMHISSTHSSWLGFEVWPRLWSQHLHHSLADI